MTRGQYQHGPGKETNKTVFVNELDIFSVINLLDLLFFIRSVWAEEIPLVEREHKCLKKIRLCILSNKKEMNGRLYKESLKNVLSLKKKKACR